MRHPGWPATAERAKRRCAGAAGCASLRAYQGRDPVLEPGAARRSRGRGSRPERTRPRTPGHWCGRTARHKRGARAANATARVRRLGPPSSPVGASSSRATSADHEAASPAPARSEDAGRPRRTVLGVDRAGSHGVRLPGGGHPLADDALSSLVSGHLDRSLRPGPTHVPAARREIQTGTAAAEPRESVTLVLVTAGGVGAE